MIRSCSISRPSASPRRRMSHTLFSLPSNTHPHEKAPAMKRISSSSARLPSRLAVTFAALASATSLQFPLNLGSNLPALHPAPLQPLGVATP